MLTCNVTVVQYLTVEPTVQWSGGSVGSGNGVMVGDTTHSGVMNMKTLTFSPLRTLHTALYYCEGIINIPMIMLRKTDRKKYIIQVDCKCLLKESEHKFLNICRLIWILYKQK